MQFIEILHTTPELFYIASALLGLVIGSFLNVVIYRLPKIMERDWRNDCCEFLEIENSEKSEKTYNLITPRSTCPHCGHKIKAIENIPVISYFFLGGKCSECKTRISIRYPAIEFLCGLLTLVIAWKFGPGITTIFSWLLTWALITLAFIDFDTTLLPDTITIPLLWLGLIANQFAIFSDLYSAVAGAIFGYLILWIVYHLFRLITGKEGMGYGDFKLLAALGAWFGWYFVPIIILLSSVAGSLIGIGLMIFSSVRRDTQIPFGPYLAIAGWVCLMWGPDLMALITSL